MGWSSAELPQVSPDNPDYWPVPIAARVLGIEEDLLKSLIKLAGIQPAAKMQMRSAKTSGRAAAAYEAAKLIQAQELLIQLQALAYG